MAALGAAGSRIAAREEPAGSVESSVVTPMPLPTVSPELPVSSGQGAERGKNLWEQICQGLEGESKDRGFWCSLKSKSVDVTYKMIELQHEVNEVKDGELYTQALR